MLPMKNWAESFEFHPKRVLTPRSTEEAQTLVKEHLKNNRNIRMRGSSHSWTELISTSDSFLHLDAMQGLINVDFAKDCLSFKAGTKLALFGEEAFKHKYALPNQGDVNHQSLAGAISTGTHGTGITLQSLANQLWAIKMITGSGDILEINKEDHPNEIKALSVSLGAAGLITEATMKMIPAYKLKIETFAEDIHLAMNNLSTRNQENRHVELFYFPVGDWVLVKIMNMTNEEDTVKTKAQKLKEVFLENMLYEGLNIFAGKTGSYRLSDKLMRKFVGHTTSVNWSHRAFPTQRSVRFMEMEFNVPFEKYEVVFQEIKVCIKKNNFQTLFPIEIRFVKGDDLWISPASERDSVYFALHTFITENYRPYFEEIQKIFKRHGGRPHWGKWHTLANKDFEQLYPKWQDFKKLRNELDPQGLWLNDHLREVFGI